MILMKPQKGHLLIAEPSIIGDLSFNRSVVLLADHNEEGSVGFILNKPLNYTIKDLIPEISASFKIYNGGPVEQDNLYFIHNVPHLISASVEIASGIYWGGNFQQTKELINKGKINRNNIRFFLGYSGWDAEQLQNELQSNSWIISENDLSNNIIGKSSSDFWREKIIQQGGEYLVWSNTPENPIYN
ncbi:MULTISPECIES: YqgE/AlgH family protein [Flavobacterium]|uniref:YqgE/AlgH family protein n=1 Tax=Flavobacterium covae TaxID=2906076 RepID=A0ABW8PEY8_9FLAO|nr:MULTISPECIES: YqgE/AlgH family protein [Flavobacterium]OXA78498.1 transcriptional regulator [Flavobacterium columnare] [Flavobacterium columnare NBRC 100251 = ATCC 23463]AMA49568.1 transcriptional regulator [Flavobacterium covae]MCJ1806004.1 YqgE/AlgH family protein [Flavobacterium covae]MCJ1808150.1 YqgE/AlgH family protein [Flavobacterium covae]OWP82512.1 transcriptional regulator [Flavobacterium covae]